MSDILSTLFNEINSSSIKKYEKIKTENRNNLTLENMLGFLIGDFVCKYYLPRLSLDFKDNGRSSFYEVSEDDKTSNKIILDDYFNNKDKSNKNRFWKKYQKHNKFIQKKYLPNPLIIDIPNFNVDAIKNIDLFLDSYISVLWDDDFCHYSLKKENIKIFNNNKGSATIEMILDE